MPNYEGGGCDRLKALERALFPLDLTNSFADFGSWLFKL